MPTISESPPPARNGKPHKSANAISLGDLAWKIWAIKNSPIARIPLQEINSTLRAALAHRRIGLLDQEQKHALNLVIPDLNKIRVLRQLMQEKSMTKK